jgi:N-acetylglutamate synthase-like GNAT family acetyltransferase
MQVQLYEGSRFALLPWFRLADESDIHIDSYFRIGDVLVARKSRRVIGMIQIFRTGDVAEIVSLAVDPDYRRQGVGTSLIQEAIKDCQRNNVRQLIVCTGSWETDNITFYEGRGFRMFNVVRDFFTAEKGYDLDVRDQVQLRKSL